jgi:hypothetical protein
MANKAERDARLDALASAVKDWANKRREYLNNQIAFSKRVLKGREGMERLNNASVEMASDLLVDEISTFLTG